MTLANHPASISSKNWVIANWKMQPTSLNDVTELLTQLTQKLPKTRLPNIALAPSFLHLTNVKTAIAQTPFALCAQNVCGQHANHGAFTGEVSAKQLVDIGVTSVIIGHSERRHYFNETDELLAKKIENAFANQLSVIFCIGESHQDYLAKNTFNVIKQQLDVLAQFASQVPLHNGNKSVTMPKILVAYEPIWAIGTGLTPSINEIEAVHKVIGETLNTLQLSAPIIYGGSVNATNASNIANIPLVDGVLVGGASLNADSFCCIINAFCDS